MSKARTDLYAIVQHSGYVFSQNPQFLRGLETALVTPKDADKIRAAGGFVGDYTEAEAKAEEESYPSEAYGGLVPQAEGTFHDKLKVRQLPVYILPTGEKRTYHLIVDQEVRHWVEVEARSPEAAAEVIASGVWDDGNNTVRRDRVRVFTEDPDGGAAPVLDTDEGYAS